MKFFPKPAWFVVVLCLVPSLAQADEASLAAWTQKTVRDALIKPLAQRESRSFSRERPPPRERRVRVLATTALTDKSGKEFVPFAIDDRFGGDTWNQNVIEGCLYRGTGYLFVKIGEDYRPSAFLLGKNVGAVKGVCVAAPPPAKS
ncbi:MAG TPA: hypothetical protein VFV94_00570 [Polyangiaceae bacterium]|nr:hypothetical protein [Polyangiaceae bacterium]